MRILVHDFAGHPFQIQLSRWLAAQGHDVRHAVCADIETPRGSLEWRESDPANLSISLLSIGRQIEKYNLPRRLRDEWNYAGVLIRDVADFEPELVISGNTSPIVQARLRRWSRRHDVSFVYWLQDIFTLALARAAANGKLMAPMRAVLEKLEFGTIGAADAAVVICDDFLPIIAARGVSTEHSEVIENWAPAEEVPIRPKDNAWSRSAGIADKYVIMYSGTLGLKHNPGLLSALAASFRDDPDVRIVVISNGMGRNWLEERKRADDLKNLLLFDFVPFETLPDCLGAADLQVAILEPHAGALSVPSKVLTYIAAEKPILGAIPSTNLAARIIAQNGLGLNVEPSDTDGFVAAAHSLRRDSLGGYLETLRAYKAEHFDIDRIGSRFLTVFSKALKRQR